MCLMNFFEPRGGHTFLPLRLASHSDASADTMAERYRHEMISSRIWLSYLTKPAHLCQKVHLALLN